MLKCHFKFVLSEKCPCILSLSFLTSAAIWQVLGVLLSNQIIYVQVPYYLKKLASVCSWINILIHQTVSDNVFTMCSLGLLQQTNQRLVAYKQHLLITFLEAGKSKVITWAGFLSGETLLPDWLLSVHCNLTW